MITVQERYEKASRDHVHKHATGETHWCTTNRCGKCGRPLQWAYDGPLSEIIIPNGTDLGDKARADYFDNDATIEHCLNESCSYRLTFGRRMRTSPWYYGPGGDGWAPEGMRPVLA